MSRYGVRRREIAQWPYREEEGGRPEGISCCLHREGGAACSSWTSGTWWVLADQPKTLKQWPNISGALFASAVSSQWEETAARWHEVVQCRHQGRLWEHQDLRRWCVSAAGREHERWRFGSPDGTMDRLRGFKNWRYLLYSFNIFKGKDVWIGGSFPL